MRLLDERANQEMEMQLTDTKLVTFMAAEELDRVDEVGVKSGRPPHPWRSDNPPRSSNCTRASLELAPIYVRLVVASRIMISRQTASRVINHFAKS